MTSGCVTVCDTTLDQTVYTIQAHKLKWKDDQENVLLSSSWSSPQQQPSKPKLKVLEKCVNCWSEGGGVAKPWNLKEQTAKVAHSPSPPPAIYIACSEGEALNTWSSSQSTTFILDSGMTVHMSHDQSYFSTYQKLAILKTIQCNQE